MTDTITIRRATVNDIEKIESMLQEAGVEPVGLREWIDSFILAEHEFEGEQEIIATAGLEKYGSKGLLRSLVFRKKAWSVEKGMDMLGLILTYGANQGLDELYLLTESPSLFIHIQFTVVEDSQIPAEIVSSLHFQQNRQRAVPMRKGLPK